MFLRCSLSSQVATHAVLGTASAAQQDSAENQPRISGERRFANRQRIAHTCASGSIKILLVMLATMLVEVLRAAQ